MLGSSILLPVNLTRDLGVYWDEHLLIKSYISNFCKAASFSLNRIGALRNYLDKSSLEQLVHAFISSKLDYCNALLYGLPDREINRLQSIQNGTVRLVSGDKRFEYIVPVLMILHWLPVRARIEPQELDIFFRKRL